MKNYLSYLPKPKNSSITVAGRQSVEDIAKLILVGIRDSKHQAECIAWYFRGKTTEETCYNVWKYLKHHVRYVRESPDVQTVKTLSRLLVTDGQGDCKHFSTAVASILKSLGINCHLRMTSFKFWDDTPTHIYVVAKDRSGSPIYVDCVLDRFNTEPSYKHKTDIKC